MRRSLRWLFIGPIICLVLFALCYQPARASGVVTNCSNDADFSAKLAGGGLVTFNCGPAATILLAGTKTIAANTTIDGGGVITLSGGGTLRHLFVNAGVELTLQNITIADGHANADGGAIYNNNGTVLISNSRLLRNSTDAPHSGGAIVSYGPLTIVNSILAYNTAGNGGAVYPRFGPARTVILNSQLYSNTASNTSDGWGGAILSWGVPPLIIADSSFSHNVARSGGAIYVYPGQTITLTGVTLNGNSAAMYGGGIYNYNTSVAILNNSTLSGNSAISGGGIWNSGTAIANNSTLSGNVGTTDGGGIWNVGTTTLNNSTLSGNFAFYSSGGLLNGGTATLNNSVLSGNSAGTYSGGIGNGGTATLNNSTLSGNNSISGGGIENSGTATLNNSTLSGNTASSGGGIDINQGTVTLNNSTLSGNSATYGGGIRNVTGMATLNNSTLSGNSATIGGGGIANSFGTVNAYNATIVFNRADADNDGSGTGGGIENNPLYIFNLRNTLVAGNRQGNGTNDCAGTIGSYGRNLFYVNAGCTIVNSGGGSWSLLGDLAGIGGLQNNGGPTLTHLPRLGSQIIDGGDAATGCTGSTGALLLTDQRGKTRPVDGDGNVTAICDVGAVERQLNDSDLAPRLWLPLIRR